MKKKLILLPLLSLLLTSCAFSFDSFGDFSKHQSSSTQTETSSSPDSSSEEEYSIVVTFESREGSYVPPYYLKEPGPIEVPQPPIRDRYNFLYWETYFGEKWDFNNFVYASMTLYAVWESQSSAKIQITNYSDLTNTDYFIGDEDNIEIVLTPQADVDSAIKSGVLTIKSSEPSIVSVNKTKISFLNQGSAKITITYSPYNYYSVSRTINFTCLGDKTEPDIIDATCEEIMSKKDTDSRYLYRGYGYVVDWGSKTGVNQYGEMGIADVSTSNNTSSDYMYVARSFVEGGSNGAFVWSGVQYGLDFKDDFLTNELTKDIHVGNKVYFLCVRKDFGGIKQVYAQITGVECINQIPAESVTLDISSLDLKIGEKAKLRQTVSPTNCTEFPTWLSYDEEIASVDQEGNILGKSEGTTFIEVRYNEKVYAKCCITVSSVMHTPVTSEFTTDYINVDAGGDAFSIWSENSIFHDPEGWLCNGWRLFLVFDAEGDLAYGVGNPANGYGFPIDNLYMRHEKYPSYLSNLAIEILEGYGPWESGGNAHNKFKIKVPEGGFGIMSHGTQNELLLRALLGDNLENYHDDFVNSDNVMIKTKAYLDGNKVTFVEN